MAARKKTTEAKITPKKTVRKSPVKIVDEEKNQNLTLEPDKPSTRRNFVKALRTYSLIVITFLIVIGIFWLAAKYLVVAWVNKKPVTRFEYYSALEKKDQKLTLDQLIRDKLLADEVAKNGIKVDQQEIDARIKLVEEQQQGPEGLDMLLQQYGLTREEFPSVIKRQLEIEKLFGSNINISDEDINKFIEENKSQITSPVDDKLRQQVKDELKSQKTNEAYTKWLQEAMQSKNVIKVV